MSDNAPGAIEIEGVHKCFGRLEVLRGVDLDVPAGSIFATDRHLLVLEASYLIVLDRLHTTVP